MINEAEIIINRLTRTTEFGSDGEIVRTVEVEETFAPAMNPWYVQSSN